MKIKTLRKQLTVVSIMLSACILGFSSIALASSSTNYRIDESFIGGGGLLQSNSTNYSGNESIGDIGVGNSNSTNFQTNGGYTTTSDPALTVVITTSTVNFGTFSTAAAQTGTTAFNVKNYTTYGYVVQISGSPPSNGSHALSAITGTPASSSAGTEQFGINLAANTLPTTFGIAPVQVPSSAFSSGSATSNYNQVNKYLYGNGDTISHATQNSGETDYTISYVVNVSPATPVGSYIGNQQLIVVGTY